MHVEELKDKTSYSGEISHGTCHFCTRYKVFIKISNVFTNLKDQMKLNLCISEALSYMHVTIETTFVGMAINYH